MNRTHRAEKNHTKPVFVLRVFLPQVMCVRARNKAQAGPGAGSIQVTLAHLQQGETDIKMTFR